MDLIQIKDYWDSLEAFGLINNGNLILGGELNLTMALMEVWSINSRSDPLEDDFSSLFERHNLVDIEPPKLIPT